MNKSKTVNVIEKIKPIILYGELQINGPIAKSREVYTICIFFLYKYRTQRISI